VLFIFLSAIVINIFSLNDVALLITVAALEKGALHEFSHQQMLALPIY
jgi:hypothetical protein